jgi:dsDNA-specific endonuclease/ATPase MutS2
MTPPPAVGDGVQTPLGKGVVVEIRSRGRLVVDLAGRRVLFDAIAVTPLDSNRKSRRRRGPPPTTSSLQKDGARDRHQAPVEVDLHGLTVAEAVARVDLTINDALLEGRWQVRVIHGRSGSRIRAAVHQQLRALPPVRAFRLDPANEGVTIVEL